MSFQVINTTETGLTDCHKLISSFMKSYIARLKPKTIFYRNYKNFYEKKFVKDVKAADFSFSNNDPNENYSVLSDTFSKLVDRHAPLKMKIQRRNHATFISREMRKAIYTRSRLRNKFCKNPSEENERKYKRQRNLFVSLRHKAIKQYFSNITSKGIVTNKEFWKTIKPFLTNKGCLENSDIMLINDDEMVTDDKTLAKTFNEHYINIVERSSGLKPEKMEFYNSLHTSRNILHSIIDRYKNHPSILKIKSEESSKSSSDTDFSRNILLTSDEVKKMLKYLNSKKQLVQLVVFDCVPHDLLIAKLAAYSVDENLLMYICSYLSNRKQCVRINNVHSRFQNVISGVPQGSIVGPTLFSFFFNDFFYFIDKAGVHNFADDNSLSAFESNIKNLKIILESESKKAISWLQSNKMIVNPGKFQGIIIDKKKQNHTAE